jgi:hypothetical protein
MGGSQRSGDHPDAPCALIDATSAAVACVHLGQDRAWGVFALTRGA